MRRDATIEATLNHLALIESAVERRRAELAGKPTNPSGLEMLTCEPQIEEWRRTEIRRTLARVIGGSRALIEWVTLRAGERVTEIRNEDDARRKAAAAAEEERINRARAEVTRRGAPVIDALKATPKRVDVETWLRRQLRLIETCEAEMTE